MNATKIPMIEIKQLTDNDWQQLATKNAMQNYFKAFGYYPEKPETALQWQKKTVCA